MKDTNYDAILTKDEMVTIIKQEVDDFDLIEFKVGPLSENPMGFMGIHYKIIAKISVNGEEHVKHYFGKKIPEDVESHNDYARKSRAFFKEIEFYKTVVQDVENNLVAKNPTKWCPKYLYSREYDLLVLENLNVQNFYMYPERMYFEMEQIILCLRAMAAMHAGPMILEQKMRDNSVKVEPKGWKRGDPVDLGELYKHIIFETECRNDVGHPGRAYHAAGFKSQLALVQLLGNRSQSEKEQIKKVLPDLMHRIFLFVNPSKKFRNTFVQGDLWANNFLFRNGPDGKMKEAIIVDFQMGRFAPPGHDFMMFLPQIQSRAFRSKHQKELLVIYHDAFTKEVEAEGYKIDDILPMAELEASCDYYYEFALLSQIMMTQLTLTTEGVTKKLLATPEQFDRNMMEDRSELLAEMFTSDELYRTRITEMMDEAIDYYKIL